LDLYVGKISQVSVNRNRRKAMIVNIASGLIAHFNQPVNHKRRRDSSELQQNEPSNDECDP